MEGQQVLENFDSLWFFATVFSNRTPPVVGKPIQNDFVGSLGEEIATPITRNEENNVCEAKEMETEEREEKRRKNRGGRSWGLEQRKKFIVGEIDLSYAVKEICECWSFEEMRIGGGEKTKKMPSFEDSMAMKEHIRSWAYAVACTVR
ncbi:uncharacterized protein LOC101209234 [Cucumis sativus]|uniref:Uncharacterized protein n=1 Tax=Cucumis sativus TaxID=3659 RepID=A0A0A0LX63_CUCSA|nr:uncharacterized protein LOC101209234 [Cucumis sativus]